VYLQSEIDSFDQAVWPKDSGFWAVNVNMIVAI